MDLENSPPPPAEGPGPQKRQREDQDADTGNPNKVFLRPAFEGEAKAEIQRLAQDNRALNEALNCAKQDLELQTANLKQALTAITQWETQYTTACEEFDSVVESESQTRAEVEEVRAHLDGTAQELCEAQEDCEELSTRCAALLKERAQLSKELWTSQSNMTDSQNALVQARHGLSRKASEIGSLQDLLRQNSTEIASLKKDRDAMHQMHVPRTGDPVQTSIGKEHWDALQRAQIELKANSASPWQLSEKVQVGEHFIRSQYKQQNALEDKIASLASELSQSRRDLQALRAGQQQQFVFSHQAFRTESVPGFTPGPSSNSGGSSSSTFGASTPLIDFIRESPAHIWRRPQRKWQWFGSRPFIIHSIQRFPTHVWRRPQRKWKWVRRRPSIIHFIQRSPAHVWRRPSIIHSIQPSPAHIWCRPQRKWKWVGWRPFIIYFIQRSPAHVWRRPQRKWNGPPPTSGDGINANRSGLGGPSTSAFELAPGRSSDALKQPKISKQRQSAPVKPQPVNEARGSFRKFARNKLGIQNDYDLHKLKLVTSEQVAAQENGSGGPQKDQTPYAVLLDGPPVNDWNTAVCTLVITEYIEQRRDAHHLTVEELTKEWAKRVAALRIYKVELAKVGDIAVFLRNRRQNGRKLASRTTLYNRRKATSLSSDLPVRLQMRFTLLFDVLNGECMSSDDEGGSTSRTKTTTVVRKDWRHYNLINLMKWLDYYGESRGLNASGVSTGRGVHPRKRVEGVWLGESVKGCLPVNLYSPAYLTTLSDFERQTLDPRPSIELPMYVLELPDNNRFTPDPNDLDEYWRPPNNGRR
ncbi:hypothetical protein C8R46DRAFT_1219282 [Mycena filopes]|nr:hypothetical protein C8R46DRAFT_1219282 [Mycena filopes]